MAFNRAVLFCYGTKKITPFCDFRRRMPFPVRTFLTDFTPRGSSSRHSGCKITNNYLDMNTCFKSLQTAWAVLRPEVAATGSPPEKLVRWPVKYRPFILL